MMNLELLLIVALIGQTRHASAVGDPPSVRHAAAVAEPFPARAIPPALRVAPPVPEVGVEPEISPIGENPSTPATEALLRLATLPEVGVGRGVDPPLDVHFSPKGGCTGEIVSRIAEARKTIRVLAFSFTSLPIADALIAAHSRGVDVRVVMDDGAASGRGSQCDRLREAGVPVELDSRHAIMHDKVVIVDENLVLAGSFNLTASAETSNAENLLTVRDAPTVRRYLADWATHAGHAKRRGDGGSQRAEAEADEAETRPVPHRSIRLVKADATGDAGQPSAPAKDTSAPAPASTLPAACPCCGPTCACVTPGDCGKVGCNCGHELVRTGGAAAAQGVVPPRPAPMVQAAVTGQASPSPRVYASPQSQSQDQAMGWAPPQPVVQPVAPPAPVISPPAASSPVFAPTTYYQYPAPQPYYALPSVPSYGGYVSPYGSAAPFCGPGGCGVSAPGGLFSGGFRFFGRR